MLHAHLPFVRHPEYDDFLEEDWLYEAITETYIPLLEVFDGLERDGVDWRLTMSVTPTLAAMLSDPLLQYRYVRHIDNLIALAGKEIERTPLAAGVQSPGPDVPTCSPAPGTCSSSSTATTCSTASGCFQTGQAGDHHLRRDARLLAADGVNANAVRAQIEVAGSIRAALRPPAAGHLAAGVRLHRRRR